jgi:DNA helicase HerA-like ATPase
MQNDQPSGDLTIKDIPENVRDEFRASEQRGIQPVDIDDDADGRTLFDTPHSEDGSLLVVFRQDRFNDWRAQSLAHIDSQGDDRRYLAQVVNGPFAEPNGLPANSPLLRVTQVEKTMFTPPYHGWVNMAILGELKDGNLIVPLHRPRPNSKVRLLTVEQTREALGCEGDIRLGQAVGFTDIPVGLNSKSKHHMPRHTLVVGTTGAGKSTFLSSFIAELAGTGFCVLIIDVEPEYAEIHKPAESQVIKTLLLDRGLSPAGIQKSYLLVPTESEAACPDHPRLRRFSLEFSNISPFLAMDLLQANDAQRDRFLTAYDAATELVTELIPSSRKQSHLAALRNWDDQEAGYPDMRLGHVLDMAQAITAVVSGAEELEDRYFHDDGFRADKSSLLRKAQTIKQRRKNDHIGSWRKTLGLVGALYRSKLFDRDGIKAADGNKISTLDYRAMLSPGHVVVIDMHGLESPQHRNLAISELLRGVMEAQDFLYTQAPPDQKPKTVVIVEEAHEFLSGNRLQQMPSLSEQIHRIARRGRKRWLGLTFATQFPQHLPDELFTLCNNRILMKLGDEHTIRRLKNSVGGVPDSLWARLRNLPTGQAILSAQGIDPAQLVSLKPGCCKLLMVD